MTKSCMLKEAFIERKLDEFQENWRTGADITEKTKQKIKDYVASRMPEELQDEAACIADYSIQHMARKIRDREGLPEPKKSSSRTKNNNRIRSCGLKPKQNRKHKEPEHTDNEDEENKPASNSITEEPENPPKEPEEPLNSDLIKSLQELIAVYTIEKIREAIEQLEN